MVDFGDFWWLAAGGLGFVIAPIIIIVQSAREGRLLRGLAIAALTVAATGIVTIVVLFSAATALIKNAIPEPQPRPSPELQQR